MKMFKLIIAALLLTPFAAQATLINFDATGSADVSGFVQWDDSALGGSNSNITDLSLTVLGVSFDLGNVGINVAARGDHRRVIRIRFQQRDFESAEHE